MIVGCAVVRLLGQRLAVGLREFAEAHTLSGNFRRPTSRRSGPHDPQRSNKTVRNDDDGIGIVCVFTQSVETLGARLPRPGINVDI